MNDIYRKPPSTPHPEVAWLFNTAQERGIGSEQLVKLTGYSRDMIDTMRRPDKHGHGANPPFQAVKELAQVLGYEFTLVRIGDE